MPYSQYYPSAQKIMSNQQKLQAGLQEMGLDLSLEQQDKLLNYIELLKKWNKTYNLTALRDESLMISHHLLDSLTLLPYVAQAQTMLDVGSGGGQPGIPTAICRPDLHITLLDANTKKTSFLQQAIIELELNNVRVISGRVETLQNYQADVITSRAFAELADFIHWTLPLLKEQGHWAAMKGIYPSEEISKLPDNIIVTKVDELHVPQLNAERHMVILHKKPT